MEEAFRKLGEIANINAHPENSIWELGYKGLTNENMK